MTRPAFKPVKPRDPEVPKAAICKLYDQLGGVKRVAVKLQLSESQAYAYTDQGVTDELSYAGAAALTAPQSPALAEHLALLAGGVFMPIACEPADFNQLTADAVRQHAEAIAAIVTGMADGKFSIAEARKALAELDQSLGPLCGIRAALVQAIGKGEGAAPPG